MRNNKIVIPIMLFFALCVLVTGSILGYLFFEEKKAQKNVYDSSAQIVQQYETKMKTKKGKVSDENDSNKDNKVIESANEIPNYEANIKNLTNEEIKNAKEKVNQLIPFVVGTIKAPSIELNLPIFEGFTTNKLALGAGTMKPGQALDKVGNFALAGHNMNTDRPILFSRITQLKDKEVIVSYKGKEQTYKITGIYQIKPTDVQHIEDTTAIAQDKRMLTLITCTLDGNNRFMVQGEAK